MIKLLLRLFAKKRMALTMKEVEMYRVEKMNEAREHILKAKLAYSTELEKCIKSHSDSCRKYEAEVVEAAQHCAADMKKHEHNFHTEMATREARIIILNKEIELLETKHRFIQEIIDTEDKVKSSMILLLNEKQVEIEKLSKALDNLTT